MSNFNVLQGKFIDVYENGKSKKIIDLKNGFFTAFRKE